MHFLRRPLLYENTYVWFIFASALDIMLTWVVLALGGRETNGVADAALRHFGLRGLVLFKFAIVTFVIGVCEIVGHHNRAAGRRLAEWAVAVTFIPVGVALMLIGTH